MNTLWTKKDDIQKIFDFFFLTTNLLFFPLFPTPYTLSSDHMSNIQPYYNADASDEDIIPRGVKILRGDTSESESESQDGQESGDDVAELEAANMSNHKHKTSDQLQAYRNDLGRLVVKTQRTPVDLRKLNGKPCNTAQARIHKSIVTWWNRGIKAEVIADSFGYNADSIKKIVKNVRDRCEWEPRAPTIRHSVADEYYQLAEEFTSQHQSFLFEQFVEHMKEGGAQYSNNTYYKILHEVGFTPKYPSRLAKLDDPYERRRRLRISTRLVEIWDDYDFIVGVDECRIDTIGLKHQKWWSKSGEPSVSSGPDNIKVGITCLLVCNQEGLHKFHCDTETFTSSKVCPLLDQFFGELSKKPQFKQTAKQKPRVLVVLDNARVHNKDKLEDVIHNLKWDIEYLPPYTPDSNPTEYFIRAFKSFLRKEYIKLPSDADEVQSKVALRNWVVRHGIHFADTFYDGPNIYNHTFRFLKALVDCGGDVIAAKNKIKRDKKSPKDRVVESDSDDEEWYP